MGRNKTIDDEAVLAAAREVFRRAGHAASTRDVARAAGISQAALYQRFGSKEELFFLSMTPDAPDLEELLGPVPTGAAREDLAALGQRLLGFIRAFTPTLLHVLAAHGTDVERLRKWHAELPFLPIAEALTQRFERMAEAGLIRAPNPHASAVAFIASIHSLAFFELMMTPQEREERHASVAALVAILWDGFRPS